MIHVSRMIRVSFYRIIFYFYGVIFPMYFSDVIKTKLFLYHSFFPTRGQHKQPETGSSDESLVHSNSELHCSVSGYHSQPGVPRRSH